ncbi:MAG: alpha/beta hydrolase family protein, partial [Candidatus Binatia bacterium]
VVSLAGVRLKRAFLDDVETLDVPAACRRISCPTLVAHGDQDRVVPVSDAETLFAALGGERRLVIYPGADHRFTNAADLAALLADASRWLEQHLSKEAA